MGVLLLRIKKKYFEIDQERGWDSISNPGSVLVTTSSLVRRCGLLYDVRVMLRSENAPSRYANSGRYQRARGPQMFAEIQCRAPRFSFHHLSLHACGPAVAVRKGASRGDRTT